jgi:hypothetical protein
MHHRLVFRCRCRGLFRYLATCLLGVFAQSIAAATLLSSPALPECGIATTTLPPPAAAQERLQFSQAVRGDKDIAWVWLAKPTLRYPHPSLGTRQHAAAVHALVNTPGGAQQELVLELPMHRVFEDLLPRLVDIDQDGRDEIVLIESSALRGASLVVLGVAKPTVKKSRGATAATGATTASATEATDMALIELARSPNSGRPFRWLNPVGMADFDSDGRQDLAAVTTPHIGGMLTLYRYRPPVLQPYAKISGITNHVMGMVEQRLAVVVESAGQRPRILIPDMNLRALHALSWGAATAAKPKEHWQELIKPLRLPANIERMTPVPDGACALLVDGAWLRLTLAP